MKSQDLCELVGAIIGNGNLWSDGSRYRIEITGHPHLDREYFNYLSTISYRLFKKLPYPLRIHQRALRWRLQSKEAYISLLEIGLPAGKEKSHSVSIPYCILQKGWNYVKWTIRGIMDTDGTIFFSKKTYEDPIYPTLEIRTCSKILANQITQILQQNGFRARPRGNQTEGYHVAIYGFKMLSLWIKEIGFSNPKHLDKIQARKCLYEKD
ncbi:MAG: hypothetical protein NWF09_05740 [Candidatus Bathyarchaeota archaeon]|nr:hypothetical protein [Candidatus Bathyarchaeota archaeon]